MNEILISDLFSPAFPSQGDGLTFPTRLVNTDVEQATVTLQPEANKK